MTARRKEDLIAYETCLFTHRKREKGKPQNKSMLMNVQGERKTGRNTPTDNFPTVSAVTCFFYCLKK